MVVISAHPLNNQTIKTVRVTQPPHTLKVVNEQSTWVPVSSQDAWNPKEVLVPREAQVRHGMFSMARSLRTAFLGRESKWKPGSGAIEGVFVQIKDGKIMRGERCPYCSRKGQNLEHWGSVACFLREDERKKLGALLFVKTHTIHLKRLKSLAFETAELRGGFSLV